jgi:hypothetical protein
MESGEQAQPAIQARNGQGISGRGLTVCRHEASCPGLDHHIPECGVISFSAAKGWNG